jgi:broad specificity phosphatase PhoE
MNRIYMIRHAKPSSTWSDLIEPDPGLGAEGEAQAGRAARALLELPLPLRPRFVVSSPLRRCIETARPFAHALGVDLEIDAAVGEIPTPARLSDAERPAWLRTAFAGRWDQIEGDIDYPAWRRSVGAAVARRGGGAVFSHYVALNAALSLATGREEVLCFQPDHASITTFEAGPDGLVLVEQGREAQTVVL